MQKEIMIAGFGGQGVLFGGQVVAYAAMDAGKDTRPESSDGGFLLDTLGKGSCLTTVSH